MFSAILRRTHMYLGLFLFPWMLMYALSTVAMNHRGFFAKTYGTGPVPFEKEREVVFASSLPPDAEPRAIARQILIALDLDGAHSASRRPDGTIVITRQDLLSPRRLTYTPASHTLLVEKIQHRPNALLERFHRRRGYATGYALDTAWAVTVDLVIVAMIGWALSGLWMWWEMKATRRLGALALVVGIGVFGLFLATL
jgi:hypothetical protein